MENPHVLDLGRADGRRRPERIVGSPEGRRGKQVVAVPIALERARRSYQRPDDVPVVDPVSVAPRQPRHDELGDAPERHLQALVEDPDPHHLPRQAGRHRVRVVFDPNRAPRRHPHVLLDPLRQPRGGHGPHHRELLGHAPRPQSVRRLEAGLHPVLVEGDGREVAAPPQEQLLLQAPLQDPVQGLDIPVLLLFPDLDRARSHPVVLHEGRVLRIEAALARPQIMGRRRGVVRLVVGRDAPEPDQRRLDAPPQRGHRLRLAARRPLPIRIRQHRVAQQVGEGLAPDRDP